MEKAMAPHSSTLAWKTPWTEEPGRLQSMGSRRFGHGWANSLSLFTFMHWRRKWQPTPVFLPGESHGWRNLVGYSPQGLQRVRHAWVTNNNNLLETSLSVQWLRLGASKAGRCGFDLRSGIFPALSVNKDVIIISDWSPPMRGCRNEKKNLPSGNHQTTATP